MKKKNKQKSKKRKFFVAISLTIIIIFLLTIIPSVLTPSQGRLTLLTVSGSENPVGGTADIHLTIRQGKGNVFIDTYPFTKLDTQVSTRFAKEVACQYSKKNCEQYDFFYTIRASSSIVGGPSAGGAIAALTVAVLDNLPIDQSTAMTGTINSGGIIGPVAGVDEKVRAAQAAGMTTVIIPRWHQPLIPANTSINATFQLADPIQWLFRSSDYNITVVEVVTLEEAILSLTGIDYSLPSGDIVVPEDYDALMREVAQLLCNRSQIIIEQLPSVLNESLSQHSLNETESSMDYAYELQLINQSNSFLSSAQEAKERSSWYSAASFCFSANLRLREAQMNNYSQERIGSIAYELKLSVNKRQQSVREYPLITLTDLQTQAIVDERYQEALTYLDEHNITARMLSYALERYYSGVVWSNFFQLQGRPLQLDEDHLERSCHSKIAEVEERKGYVSALFGTLFESHPDLDDAYVYEEEKSYALCLFKASKAKARINLILLSIGVGDDDFKHIIDEQLLVAKGVLHRESLHERFPVMGYSYYEYAQSLRESDPYTSALFSSYALELSDLSMYFPENATLTSKIIPYLKNSFFLGIIIGVLIMFLFIVLQK